MQVFPYVLKIKGHCTQIPQISMSCIVFKVADKHSVLSEHQDLQGGLTEAVP